MFEAMTHRSGWLAIATVAALALPGCGSSPRGEPAPQPTPAPEVERLTPTEYEAQVAPRMSRTLRAVSGLSTTLFGSKTAVDAAHSAQRRVDQLAAFLTDLSPPAVYERTNATLSNELGILSNSLGDYVDASESLDHGRADRALTGLSESLAAMQTELERISG